MTNEPWVALEAIAQHLNVSQDTVRRWIRNRGLPGNKIGHVWRFKISDVDNWVRTRKQTKNNDTN